MGGVSRGAVERLVRRAEVLRTCLRSQSGFTATIESSSLDSKILDWDTVADLSL